MTPDATRGDAPTSDLSACTRCGMEVLASEMWAHTAHAHNVDLDAKKPKGRGKPRNRERT